MNCMLCSLYLNEDWSHATVTLGSCNGVLLGFLITSQGWDIGEVTVCPFIENWYRKKAIFFTVCVCKIKREIYIVLLQALSGLYFLKLSDFWIPNGLQITFCFNLFIWISISDWLGSKSPRKLSSPFWLSCSILVFWKSVFSLQNCRKRVSQIL